MTIRPITRISVLLAAFGIFVLSVVSTDAGSQDKPFRNDVITQVEIGDIKSGKYLMKATITTIQPHAKIPFHLHKYNGLRYLLEGSLSISWKDGQSRISAVCSCTDFTSCRLLCWLCCQPPSELTR